MAGGEQLEGIGGYRRAHAVQLGTETGPGHPQIRPRQRLERGGERLRLCLHPARERFEHPLDLPLFVEGGLGPGVVQLHHAQRLDEESRTRCALVVDDALDPALGLGAHGYDVAAGPDGHDRLADGARQVGRAQHGVQALADAILGGPHPLADGGEVRRCGVQDLAGLVDAALDPFAERRRVLQQVAHLPEVRATPAGETRGEAGRGAKRIGDLQELRGGKAPPAPGALECSANVPCPAHRGLRLLVQEPGGFVGLLLEQGDVARMCHGQHGLGQLARRRERGPRREALDDRAELQGAQGSWISRGAGCRRPIRISDGRRAGHRSPGSDTVERPMHPRRRRPRGAGARSAWRGGHP